MQTENSEVELADCLARLTPFAEHVIVADSNSSDRTTEIATEYGAEIVLANGSNQNSILKQLGEQISSRVIGWLKPEHKLTEKDWGSLRSIAAQSADQPQSMILASGQAIEITFKPSLIQQGESYAAMQLYLEAFHPHLGKRAATFRQMLQYLETLHPTPPLIVETGCTGVPNDWDAGQSTLIFRQLHRQRRWSLDEC